MAYEHYIKIQLKNTNDKTYEPIIIKTKFPGNIPRIRIREFSDIYQIHHFGKRETVVHSFIGTLAKNEKDIKYEIQRKTKGTQSIWLYIFRNETGDTIYRADAGKFEIIKGGKI